MKDNIMTEKDIFLRRLLIDQKLKYALTEFKYSVEHAYNPSKYGGTRVFGIPLQQVNKG
jgi:hypothetical protein